MFSFIGFKTRWTKQEVTILQENFGDLMEKKKVPITSSYQKSKILRFTSKSSSNNSKIAGFNEVLLILYVFCLYIV